MTQPAGPPPEPPHHPAQRPEGDGPPPQAPGWEQAAWPGWSAPHPSPARHRGRRAASVLALVTAGALIGAGVTVAARRAPGASITSSLPTVFSPAQTPASGAPTPAPLPTPPPRSSVGGGSLDIATIASRVDPAIVDINVTVGAQGQAAGTGMILTSTGEVLTNNHVVEGATSVSLQVNGRGPQYRGTVLGVDPADDVALVQMNNASGLATVPLGNSSSVSVGDAIVALGNALGRGGTPTATPGVVTALDQTITASDSDGANAETLAGMIQVRAGIEPGDSGGPMVDRAGHVVGMTTAGSARARRAGTVGFAIPINTALAIARQVQSGSGPNVQAGQRGILGVEVDPSAGGGDGAVVAQVQDGSPAAAAGIVGGDVITGVDGTTVDSADGLRAALQHHRPKDTVTVEWVDAAGRRHSGHVTLAAGPPA